MPRGGKREGAGRPRTSTRISLRLTLTELEELRRRAAAAGMEVSQYLRTRALAD